jgi:glycosyltransferase involved in cell wall biosynthesis
MDVLVNATTLVKGGGVQVATSFVVEAEKAKARDIRWHYALSKEVVAELAALDIVPERMYVFEDSPARNKKCRQTVLRLEEQLRPDVVFSVFGPAFVKFRSPHLMGMGNGWITHSTWLAFRSLGSLQKIVKQFAGAVYKGYWARFANRWVVEATNSRDGMVRRLHIEPAAVAVVPNSCAALFGDAKVPDAVFPILGKTVRLLYLSAWYAHKNIQSIPYVAAELKRLAPERDIKFVLTVPNDEPGLAGLLDDALRLGVMEAIDNRGRVPLADAAGLYASADACFMPSLLETFSANYPEAMVTGRPIIASDLDFAHAICGDAAKYFTATSPAAAAQAILELLNDRSAWEELVASGRTLVAELPTPQSKYARYEELIRETAVAAA